MNKTERSYTQEDFSNQDLSGFTFINCKFYTKCILYLTKRHQKELT